MAAKAAHKGMRTDAEYVLSAPRVMFNYPHDAPFFCDKLRDLPPEYAPKMPSISAGCQADTSADSWR